MTDWSYDAWPSGEPYNWGGAGRGDTVWAARDYHVDLGCGTLKKGRIGIDHFGAPGVNIIMDLDRLAVFSTAAAPGEDAPIPEEVEYRGENLGYGSISKGSLPFADASIESIITHHCLEHIGEGFLPLMNEVYRVMKPGGILYAITPLFPSHAAVADPDHKRYFMLETWLGFCGHLGDEANPSGSWLDAFSVPYTKARFKMVHSDHTAPTEPSKQWTVEDTRELRVALECVK